MFAKGGGRYEFRLAEAQDDEQLRQLLRETPMEGRVRLTLRREPSYFDAAVVEGPQRQVLVVCDKQTRRIVGCATRSIRDRLIDGEPVAVGYLGGLRIHPAHRNGTLLARGYRALRHLHDDGQTAFYITTIAEGNRSALTTLPTGRASLPTYLFLGRYITLALSLRRRPACRRQLNVQLRPATSADWPRLLAFVRKAGARQQLFPHYTPADFEGEARTFRGLAPSDLMLAWRDGEIVGCMAAWDQTSFRQTVVEGYSGSRWYRGMINLWLRFRGAPEYPSVGQQLPLTLVALPLVEPGIPQILDLLIDYLRERSPGTQAQGILAGFAESDPCLSRLRRHALFEYVSRVYAVYWGTPPAQLQRLVGSHFYLELGCL